MPEVKLIPATVADIPVIAKLADTVWYQYYPDIISRNQIAYMLRLMYSRESLTEQMEVKKHQFHLIENNGKTIGFISVADEGLSKFFINKFYIDQTKAGKGFGSEAYAHLRELTEARSFRLTVNRQNFKAINFYFKVGFKIAKVADFDIGDGYVMNDFVMEAILAH